jgi:hypothetical protein
MQAGRIVVTTPYATDEWLSSQPPSDLPLQNPRPATGRRINDVLHRSHPSNLSWVTSFQPSLWPLLPALEIL